MPQGSLLTETYANAFEALQYVTNPYALFGFLFLVLIGVLSVLPGINPKLRFGTISACGVLVLLMAGLSLQSALHNVRDNTLVHLVRDDEAGPVRITDRVAVKRSNIETLKGKDKPDEDPGGHTFNKRLGDSKHIFEMVLRKAGIQIVSAQELLQMEGILVQPEQRTTRERTTRLLKILATEPPPALPWTT